MNEEERRRLLEQLGFSRLPVATNYGTGTQTWEEILNPLGVQTQEQNKLQALGFGDPLVTITDNPYAAPRVDPTYVLPTTTQQYDKSRWDMLPPIQNPGVPMPNMEVDQPLTTGLVPASATTPVQAGMAEVELPFFSRFPLAQQAMDQGTFDALEHVDSIMGGASQESQKDTAGRMAWKEVVGALPTTGLLGDISNWAISTVMHKGLPFSGFTGDDIATAKTAESIKDAVNNEIIMSAKKAGIPKNDLVASIVTGVNPLIQTSAEPLKAAEEYVAKGGKLDQNDLIEMAYQQDTFKDIQQVAEDTSARDRAEAARQAAINAQMAQEAAARQRQQQQAAAAEQARQAQVVAAQEDAARQAALARQVYAQLMSGRDRGEPSAREVQAAMERAAQIDTFSEAGRDGDRGMGNLGGEMGAWT